MGVLASANGIMDRLDRLAGQTDDKIACVLDAASCAT